MKKVLIIVGVLIAGILLYAAVKPPDFRVERSVVIAAPAEKVFPYVNDQHNVNSWSPWLKMDPDAKGTYEGPSSGVGAKFSWDGNNKVGQGSATITESIPNERVSVRLDFLKPMQATNSAEYILKSNGNETTVTWAMFGKSTYICRIMTIFMSMDKMVGETFEKGLADLKTLVESNK